MAKKNTWLAMILSFLVYGLGLAYDGVYKRFLIYLILGSILTYLWWILGGTLDPEVSNEAVVCAYSAIIVWIFGLYDTLRTTIDINRGN